ncbi:MAG: formate dehydrogenase accessory sulfurtransferase FdhD [Rhodocyclaceae bacterium]|nr:formate dehydrogenase accessory sulfurtransferase FdhD [Rhodocyclaceae bacterium]
MAIPCPRPPTPEAPPETARNRHALRVGSTGTAVDRIETLPEEVPVALVYNGISHAVMLATPAELEDFALGFSLSEGILEKPGQLYDCQVEVRENGMEVHLEIATERFLGLKERRRNLAGRTGCGLCGVESLDAVCRPLPPVGRRLRLPVAAIHLALASLHEHQSLHRRTHAVHAAAWVDGAGRILAIREDVGRHNALDKLIGHLARTGFDAATGFVLVTSRASVEMAQKAAAVGMELLFSISAPTALAVETAEAAGLTLAGSVFDDGFSIHTHPERITLDSY